MTNFTNFDEEDTLSFADGDYLVGHTADYSKELRVKRRNAIPLAPLSRRHSFIGPVEAISVANNASGLTFRAAHSFRAKPLAARLVFYNTLGVALNFSQTGAATMKSINASLSPAVSTEWTAGGAVNVPQAQVAGSQTSIAFSPWIPVYAQESADDPGTWPVTVYAYLDSSQPNYSANSYDISWMENEAKKSGGYFAQRAQPGDQATNPGTFSSTTVQNRGPIAGIEILSEKYGATNGMILGDSISAGAGQTSLGKTDLYRAMQAINLLGGRAIGYVAAGWGGQNSTTYLARAMYLLPLIKPDFLLLTCGTPNDGVPSVVGQRTNRFYLSQVIDLARSLGIRVIMRGWAPHSVVADNWPQGTLTDTPTNTVNGDVYRQDQNARCLAMDGIGNITFVAGPSALGDGAQPERYLPQYTTDLNHPNDAGYALSATNVQPGIQRILGWHR